MEGKIVIIGGGIGGLYTALNLIENGVSAGRISIVAKEWPPYTRHRLAEVLSTERSIGRTVLNAGRTVQEAGVSVIRGEAIGIVPGRKLVSVRTETGNDRLGYDKLVVATGGRPFVPPIPGIQAKEGIATFHGWKDVEFLESLPSGGTALIMGAGLVGLTAAAALKKRGHEAIVVEARERILPNILTGELSELLEEHLLSAGIRILTGSLVSRILGDGKVEGVELNGGRKLTADAVVLATGIKPNSRLVRNDGKPVEIDLRGRTAIPNVYALGDCAMSWDFITGKKVYRPLGFVAGHYARVIAGDISRNGEDDRGVIPVIYERIGRAEVYSIGLTVAEAERLGFTVRIRNSKGSAWREALITDEVGRVLGWQRVQIGRFHSVNSAKAYAKIKEAWSKQSSSRSRHPLSHP